MSEAAATRTDACLLESLFARGELQALTATLADTAALIGEALGAVAVDLWVSTDGGVRAFEPWGLPQQAELISDADGWIEVPGNAWPVGRACETGTCLWTPAEDPGGVTGGSDEPGRHAGTLVVPLTVAGRNRGTLEVIAVAACHLAGPAPADPETAGSSRLWQAAAGAVAVALSIEAMRKEAGQAGDQIRSLREQENARARVSFAQQKLLDAAIGKSSSRAAHLAEVVSSALNRSILVVDAEGHELASVAGGAEREMLRAAAQAVLAKAPAPRDITGRLLSVDGQTGCAAGAILVTPAVAPREVDATRLIACLADLLSTKLGMLKHEGRMVDVVRPLALLGLCARESNDLRRKDLADLLTISARTPLRVASIRTPTPEAAFRCATAIGRASEAGLGVIAAAALGNDVVVLLRDDAPDAEERLRRLRALLAVQVSIGVSSGLSGIDAIAAGYKESQTAIGRAGDKASVSFYADAPRLRHIVEDLAGGEGERGLRGVLGPILDLERAEREDILGVLNAFIEHNGDRAALSAALDRDSAVLAGLLARAAALTRLDFALYQDVATLAAALEYLGARARQNRQGA